MHKIITALITCSFLAFGAITTPEASLDAKLILKPAAGTRRTPVPLRFTMATPAGQLQLPAPEIRDGDQTITVTFTTSDFVWKTELNPRGSLILATSTITATGEAELKLEPGLALDCRKAGIRNFWEGYSSLRDVKDTPLERKGLKGNFVEAHIGASTMPFPANAVSNAWRAYTLGTYPFDCISYTATSYDPADRQFHASIRTVVSKGQTVTFRQVIGTVEAPYGIQEAIVQRYYEAFPEAYEPVCGQDNPFVWGGHGNYLSWWFKPDYELYRRFFSTIEWTYTPYRRSGDMICEPRFWDYTPANPFRSQKGELGGLTTDQANVQAAPYYKLIKERFLACGQRFGWMFYNTVSGTWCEKQLALKHFQDSIIDDRDGGIDNEKKTWSTHHDAELRVLPYHTSFAQKFESDMAKLAADMNVPGFALDCSYAGAYYRGPATKLPIPGRAWDDKGVFIDQIVAINHEVDVIHSLKTLDGKPLTVFFNGYLKGDYCMMETSFTDTGTMARWMPLVRWHVGPRPATMHTSGFDIKNVIPDWRNMAPQKFQDMLERISDFNILNQFQYAACNDYTSMYGNPQMLYIQPEAMELMRTRWQAEIPVRLDIRDNGRIRYRARYGTAEQTILYFGNSSPNDTQCELVIDCTRLTKDHSTLVFVRKMRNHASTANRINGTDTAIDFTAPSRIPVLFEAVASLKGAEGTLVINASKSLNKQTFTLTANKPFKASLTPKSIRGFRLSTIANGSKTLQLKDEKPVGPVHFEPGVPVTLDYDSTVFHCSEEHIFALPFTNESDAVAFAVQATPEAKDAAQRFADYFTFCAAHQGIDKKSPAVAITISDKAAPAPHSVLVKTGPPCSVSRDQATGGLIVTAPDAAQLDATVTALFRVLDKRYPCNLGFKSVMGMQTPILKHFKLFGKSLSLRRYFEQEATK